MNLRRYLLWYDQKIEFTEIFVKSSMEENFKTISINKKKKKNVKYKGGMSEDLLNLEMLKRYDKI